MLCYFWYTSTLVGHIYKITHRFKYNIGGCSRDCMVHGFTTKKAISANHHWNCEFESGSWRDVLETTLCDNVVSDLRHVSGFFPCVPVSSTNKTDHHDITEILLKVALNTITLTPFGETYCSHPICPLITNVCMCNSSYIFNWNSSNLCMLVYYQM
jgi:hypothetical protein